MSDYTQSIDFSAKDALSTGDPNKVAKGADIDTELGLISTAVATKYDSTDLSTQAQAEALTIDTVLITPHSLNDVLVDNGGMAKDIQQLADPGADRILFWDNSGTAAALLTVSTGLTISTTNLTTDDANIDHDALSNFVADEHVAHTGVDMIAGDGLTGGGTIDSTRTFTVVGGDGITANANDIALTAAAATTTNPVDISTGTVSIDLTALNQYTVTDIAGADEFLIDDGGVSKAMRYQDFGVPQTDDTTTTPFSSLALADANRWFNCNNASAVTATIPADASVAFPVGTTFALHQRGAGQITVAVTSDTLRSPNGAKTANQYSTIFVTKIASTEWVITGDSTS